MQSDHDRRWSSPSTRAVVRTILYVIPLITNEPGVEGTFSRPIDVRVAARSDLAHASVRQTGR